MGRLQTPCRGSDLLQSHKGLHTEVQSLKRTKTFIHPGYSFLECLRSHLHSPSNHWNAVPRGSRLQRLSHLNMPWFRNERSSACLRTCSGVQNMCASSWQNLRTRVRPPRAPESSLRCSAPKSAHRRGSSLHERTRCSNIRLNTTKESQSLQRHPSTGR